MSIELFLYLSDVVNSLKSLLLLMTVLFFLIMGITLLISGVEYSCSYEKLEDSFFYKVVNIFKKYFGWALFLLFISCAIPSQKTMYLMLAANTIKESTIPEKVEMVINKKLDEFLNENPRRKNNES